MKGMKPGTTVLGPETVSGGVATLTLPSKKVLKMPLEIVYSGDKNFLTSADSPAMLTKSGLKSVARSESPGMGSMSWYEDVIDYLIPSSGQSRPSTPGRVRSPGAEGRIGSRLLYSARERGRERSGEDRVAKVAIGSRAFSRRPTLILSLCPRDWLPSP